MAVAGRTLKQNMTTLGPKVLPLSEKVSLPRGPRAALNLSCACLRGPGAVLAAAAV